MSRFQKNKEWRRIFYSKIVLILLIAIFGGAVMSLVRIVPKVIEASEKKEKALREYESLRDQETSLRTKIERLQTEEGIEENIRDKFRAVKEGEKLVVIIDEPEKEELLVKEKNFWVFIKGLFDMRD